MPRALDRLVDEQGTHGSRSRHGIIRWSKRIQAQQAARHGEQCGKPLQAEQPPYRLAEMRIGRQGVTFKDRVARRAGGESMQ